MPAAKNNCGCFYSASLSAQETIEIQFLKPWSFLRTFKNLPMRMMDSNNSVCKYLEHILYIKKKLKDVQ